MTVNVWRCKDERSPTRALSRSIVSAAEITFSKTKLFCQSFVLNYRLCVEFHFTSRVCLADENHTAFGFPHLTGEKYSLVDEDIMIMQRCGSCNYGGDSLVHMCEFLFLSEYIAMLFPFLALANVWVMNQWPGYSLSSSSFIVIGQYLNQHVLTRPTVSFDRRHP